MTSSPKIPSISKEPKVATGIKSLIGQQVTKEIPFMGAKIAIKKLSVDEVMEIQNLVRGLQKTAEAAEGSESDGDDGNLEMLHTIVTKGVVEADDLTIEQLRTFPMEELNKLTEEVMKYSGYGKDQGK